MIRCSEKQTRRSENLQELIHQQECGMFIIRQEIIPGDEGFIMVSSVLPEVPDVPRRRFGVDL